MAVKTFKKGSKTKLLENFKAYEFDCKCKDSCSNTFVDEKLVDYLQKIRTHFGKSVIINSAYRCEKHNKAVGGASSSNHTKGQAADIVVKGVKPAEVAKYAETIGVLGIGLYEGKDGNFVHVDTRAKQSFWYGHAQAKRTTFGGENIIKAWQIAARADKYAVETTGIWDGISSSVAKRAICKKYLIGYKNKNLTKIVQKAVGVTADGKFGKDTKTAVIKWQKLMGLNADGIVGYNTWRKILGV
ncbi:MAG: D-Ala-D-Ala carboxypeptidase family metallohydrolase [Fibrobacteraceae bacterium]|nr:D-Ala-D-Ala carboxypeptidase family metallohydrolase [Fibrobacteraceae bacterium]